MENLLELLANENYKKMFVDDFVRLLTSIVSHPKRQVGYIKNTLGSVAAVEGLVAIGKRSKVKVEYLFNEQGDWEFIAAHFDTSVSSVIITLSLENR